MDIELLHFVSPLKNRGSSIAADSRMAKLMLASKPSWH